MACHKPRQPGKKPYTAAIHSDFSPFLATISPVSLCGVPNKIPSFSNHVMTEIKVSGHSTKALVDTGASACFIDIKLVKQLKLRMFSAEDTVCLATASQKLKVLGFCIENIVFQGNSYPEYKCLVMSNLVVPFIIGEEFMKRLLPILEEVDRQWPWPL